MANPTIRPWLFSLFIPVLAFGDEPPRLHPVVLEMKAPTCPPMVRLSGISGTAKFLVRTDGHQIQEILKSDGPPMLQRQLPSQLMSWRFAEHSPLEFTITFKVTVVFRNPCDPRLPEEVKMVLPSLVEITSYSVGECDPVITPSPSK